MLPERLERKPRAVVSKYSPWHELLRLTFGEEVVCQDCGGRLRLIALVKKEETIQAVLRALRLATGPPQVANPGRPDSSEEGLENGGEGEGADWPEYSDG